MNKDALLATLIGFAIGLLITGILLVGPNIMKYIPTINLPSLTKQQEQGNVTPTPKTQNTTFAIESPLPDAIENSSDLLVNGSAKPGAIVVIAGPNDESVISVSEDAKYAGKITLSEGKNDILVTSLLEGNNESKSITVYYTEESL